MTIKGWLPIGDGDTNPPFSHISFTGSWLPPAENYMPGATIMIDQPNGKRIMYVCISLPIHPVTPTPTREGDENV